MEREIEQAFEAAEKEIWELWGCEKGEDDTPFPSAIMEAHIGPLLAGDAMRSKYKFYRNLIDEMSLKQRNLETQIADLKEQAAIMDSVHKEVMEKLERYEKALEALIKVSKNSEMALISGYYVRKVARDALA